MALLGKVIVAMFLLIVTFSFIGDCVDRGVFPHTANIKLSMAGNWLENESRTCVSGYVYDEGKRVYSAQTLDVQTTLSWRRSTICQ